MVRRRNNLIHPVCRSEESGVFTGRRENLIHPLRHSEERIVRRENLILHSILKLRHGKMRSSRPRKTRAQDDGLKAHPPLSPLNGGIYKMVFTG